MTNEGQEGINDDRVSSEFLDKEPKSYEDQVKHESVDIQVMTLPMSTSSLAEDAAAVLQTLGLQTSDETALKAIAHIEQDIDIPNHLAHKVIGYQSQIAPPAEDIINDPLQDVINEDQVIIASSNQKKEDMDQGETSVVKDDSVASEVVTVPTSTSSFAADSAAVETLTTQMSGLTIPESIDDYNKDNDSAEITSWCVEYQVWSPKNP